MSLAYQSAPASMSARKSHHCVSIHERAKCLLLPIFAIAAILVSPARVHAADMGNVHGVVHDANHRPVAAASVQLKAAKSDWARSAQTGPDGEFAFPGVPLGDYVLNVSQSGFVTTALPMTVVAGAARQPMSS